MVRSPELIWILHSARESVRTLTALRSDLGDKPMVYWKNRTDFFPLRTARFHSAVTAGVQPTDDTPTMPHISGEQFSARAECLEWRRALSPIGARSIRSPSTLASYWTRRLRLLHRRRLDARAGGHRLLDAGLERTPSSAFAWVAAPCSPRRVAPSHSAAARCRQRRCL